MNLIVAVDENWGIGFQGDLLERISGDMKFFRELTTSHTVIMGRVTFESLPDRKPLPNRKNIVLSTKSNGFPEDIIQCESVSHLFDLLKNMETDEVFVIGGEKIYELLIPYCDTAYVTKIHKKYISDKKMVNLDNLSDWSLVSESDLKTSKKGTEYHFCKYQRKN